MLAIHSLNIDHLSILVAVPPKKWQVLQQTTIEEVCWKISLRSAWVSDKMLRLTTGSDTATGKAYANTPGVVSRNDTGEEIVIRCTLEEQSARCPLCRKKIITSVANFVAYNTFQGALTPAHLTDSGLL